MEQTVKEDVEHLQVRVEALEEGFAEVLRQAATWTSPDIMLGLLRGLSGSFVAGYPDPVSKEVHRLLAQLDPRP